MLTERGVGTSRISTDTSDAPAMVPAPTCCFLNHQCDAVFSVRTRQILARMHRERFRNAMHTAAIRQRLKKQHHMKCNHATHQEAVRELDLYEYYPDNLSPPDRTVYTCYGTEKMYEIKQIKNRFNIVRVRS